MQHPDALRRAITPREMVDFAIAQGLPGFAPGSPGQWACSNTGYALLGLVIDAPEGLPRSWLMPPCDVETTAWNVSQSWAGGGVISTPDDMHRFITALTAGEVFARPETLALMQDTLPTPIPGTSGHGLGLIQLEGEVWGLGGQTLGFISTLGADAGSGVSFVAWGNSAANPVVLLAPEILGVLRAAGVLAEQ